MEKKKDNYAIFANRLFGKVAESDYSILTNLKEDLKKSGLNYLFKTYVSQMILTSIIVFVIFLITFLLMALILSFSVAQIILFAVLSPLFISFLTLGFLYYYPASVVKKKESDIDLNLPFALNHMSAVISSGIPPTSLFELLRNFEEYGTISKESRKIVRRIKLLGEDIITALKEVSKTTPSGKFREILYGIISTLETGGDLKSYLAEKSKETLFEYKLDRRKRIEKLSLYSTIYMSILMAAPLFLIAILSILNFVGGSILGVEIVTLLRFSIYLVIPLLNVIFISILLAVGGER